MANKNIKKIYNVFNVKHYFIDLKFLLKLFWLSLQRNVSEGSKKLFVFILLIF